MRVALVHDYLVQYGGAERVLEMLADIFPTAPIYTLIYDSEQLYGAFSDKKIRTSFLQNLPFSKTNHRLFPALMPLAVEDLDLTAYDLVISSSNSYTKGVITRPDAIHICYCHTPMRYAWDDYHRHFQEFNFVAGIRNLLPFAMNYIRLWDKISADRVDYYLANSHNVANRINKYYRMPAQVLYPPVNTEVEFDADSKGEYYLMLGRFLPYKHYDIVLEAFAQNGKTLHLVGSGPDEEKLRKIAQGKNNIKLLGRLSDEEAQREFRECRAFIFASEDDFGIVPVEAMAVGKPVIAYGRGGALETVEDGKTGIFFDEQSANSINQAIERFETMDFDANYIHNYAQKFSKDAFKHNFYKFLEQYDIM
ncbi:glycosyltransferase family 4 protein [bacterium]|nr:glycosyltransferase family 4 protein [Candidatus Elulimicrobium humile]